MTNKNDLDPAAEVKRAEPDLLIQATHAVELSEEVLGKVTAGGKAKTADKAFNAMDGCIRS